MKQFCDLNSEIPYIVALLH